MRPIQAKANSADNPELKILEAGLRVFAERGFEGSATREIAKQAGVPLGLLSYYFGGKEKLWRAVVDHAFDEIDDAIELVTNAAAEGDIIAGIGAGIRAHVNYVGRHPEFIRLMHDEGKRKGPRMRWLVDRHVRPLFGRLIPMIEHLQSIGRLPDTIAAMHFAYALVGAIDVIFHQAEECRRVTGADPTDPEVIEAHAQAVEFMFLGAPPITTTL